MNWKVINRIMWILIAIAAAGWFYMYSNVFHKVQVIPLENNVWKAAMTGPACDSLESADPGAYLWRPLSPAKSMGYLVVADKAFALIPGSDYRYLTQKGETGIIKAPSFVATFVGYKTVTTYNLQGQTFVNKYPVVSKGGQQVALINATCERP